MQELKREEKIHSKALYIVLKTSEEVPKGWAGVIPDCAVIMQQH